MLKLCWKKDNNILHEYYCDMGTYEVYKLYPEDYRSQTKIQIPNNIVYVMGPLATITGVLFDKIKMVWNIFSILACFALLIGTMILINKGVNFSEKQKEEYIRKNIEGECLSYTKTYELYRQGRRERWGLSVFGVFFLVACPIIIEMYKKEQNITSVLLAYTSIWGICIFIKLIRPIKKQQFAI
ncbi:MAG: hypothetical protein RR746_08580, partial [Lachnospiraceae bacterium]